MKKQIADVALEFGTQTKKYMKHFGLEKIDLQTLASLTKNDLEDILNGKKGVVLKTAEKLSNVFALRYFEYGNPDYPFPELQHLPVDTQNAIMIRKTIGKPKTRSIKKKNLSANIIDVLNSKKLSEEFTSSDILKLLPLALSSKIKSIRITDELKKGDLKALVEETGEKRGREKVYKLSQHIE